MITVQQVFDMAIHIVDEQNGSTAVFFMAGRERERASVSQ